MTQSLTDKSVDFLWELTLHNERPWFREHKEEFEAVLHRPFRELATETCARMQERWPERAFTLHISRIYRDARRLYGRGPYQDNLWFSLQKGDAHARGPMFWFELNRDGSSHGVGFWDRTARQAEVFRRKVDRDPDRFVKVVQSLPDWKEKGRIWGEEYRRPRGDRGEVLNPWYNRKQASGGYENYFGQQLFSTGLPGRLADSFSSLMPLYDYFREAYEEAMETEYHP